MILENAVMTPAGEGWSARLHESNEDTVCTWELPVVSWVLRPSDGVTDDGWTADALVIDMDYGPVLMSWLADQNKTTGTEYLFHGELPEEHFIDAPRRKVHHGCIKKKEKQTGPDTGRKGSGYGKDDG